MTIAVHLTTKVLLCLLSLVVMNLNFMIHGQICQNTMNLLEGENETEVIEELASSHGMQLRDRTQLRPPVEYTNLHPHIVNVNILNKRLQFMLPMVMCGRLYVAGSLALHFHPARSVTVASRARTPINAVPFVRFASSSSASLTNTKRKMVTLSSHDVNGLSKRDIKMAMFMDKNFS
ncbi:unnamed protein product [Chilo suppressalis]|uniref:Uncharacterized protein n=1 Tax=Chilo suppressalis TaxID=168631 RepID=A0ABN8B1Y0_CHISP|nr:unnamed protein product [Chilo suppressalis]